MSDAPRTDGPPPFESPFDDADVERRIYGVVLQTRDPTAASAIADDADCDPKTARKYLDWFAELGIVTERDGHPTTYERNDSYFEWRRVSRLSASHSTDELVQRVDELTRRIRRYEEAYDASSPGDVDAIDAAEARADATIDDVYADLGDWETALEERRQYERARQQRSGNPERVSG